MFAFEYHQISNFMPSVIKGEEYPESKIRSEKRLNVAMFILNIVTAIVNAIFLCIWNLYYYGYLEDSRIKNYIIISIICTALVTSTAAISCVFLANAILKIRKLLSTGKEMVDIRILVLHFLTFGLLLISIFVWWIFNSIYYLRLANLETSDEDAYVLSGIVFSACAFVSQVCLGGILWTLRNSNEQAILQSPDVNQAAHQD